MYTGGQVALLLTFNMILNFQSKGYRLAHLAVSI